MSRKRVLGEHMILFSWFFFLLSRFILIISGLTLKLLAFIQSALGNYMEVLLGSFFVFSSSFSGFMFIFLRTAMAVTSSFTSEGTTELRFVLVPSSLAGKMAWILLLKRALICWWQVNLTTLIPLRSSLLKVFLSDFFLFYIIDGHSISAKFIKP